MSDEPDPAAEAEPEASHNKWPDFNKPATKGDLMVALATVRTCVVHTYVALRASQRNDAETLDKYLKELDASDDFLSRIIDAIGKGTLDEVLKDAR